MRILPNARFLIRQLMACSTTAVEHASHHHALRKFIVDKIRATGPITVAEYMRLCVGAPQVGYYGGFSQERAIFGQAGDFITSPELSQKTNALQIFGELIGVWLLHELECTGFTGEIALVESGPGTGQLMEDIKRVLKFANDKTTFSIHLVETSHALMKRQAEKLCKAEVSSVEHSAKSGVVQSGKTAEGIPVYWYHTIDDIPQQFSVFVSNEFLDALPIHQFKRDTWGKWHEVYINMDENGELVFMLSRGENLHIKGLLPESIREDKEREVYEVAPDAGIYVNQVAQRMIHNGGFALMIDYGNDGTRKDASLRAYKRHKQVPPLAHPGAIDLTADVNFAYLRSLVEDRTLVFGPQKQREFLGQLGIASRLRSLLKACKSAEDEKNLLRFAQFLLGDMGDKFHCFAMFPKTLENILVKRGGPSGFVGCKSSLLV